MRTDQTTVGKLFQGQRQYLVPLYQRRYSWIRDEIRQVWSDLVAVSESPTTTHFLGSVVLAESPFHPSGVEKWLLVDGQQRLTTLSILFCALRDHARSIHPQFAEKVDDLYLINRYYEGEDRLKLLPTQEDRAPWVALLESAPRAGGEDKIGEAYHFFRKELARTEDDEASVDLARIERAVAGQLDIVSIIAGKDDNVHRIFESLNHTGRPLTQADLLRNYLFMRLPTRAREIYNRHWLPLQQLLDDQELEQLVWLDLVVTGDDRVTQETVYQAQQARLRSLASESDVEQWVVELHRKARLFHRIVKPQVENDPQLREALDRLRRWGATVVRPIVLHVLSAQDRGVITAAEAADALRVVESYLVRRMLVGIASAGTNRTLSALVNDLDGVVPSAANIMKELSSPRRRFPTDEQVRDAVLDGNFYWSGRSNQRAFILRSIEEDFGHRERIDLSTVELTIEHVLPQHPSDDWWKMLGHDLRPGENAEDVHSALVHTLGNLTLTAYNGKLANDSFSAKRAILADSGLALNRELAAKKTWGRRQIQERGRVLGERIARIWPGPASADTVSPAKLKWLRLPQILASIPAGRWTSYSDIAEVIGSHQMAVGSRLASGEYANAHRVLRLKGTLSSDFTWAPPGRPETQREVLEAEGIRFDSGGKAAPEQRLKARDLATAIDLDPPD